MAPHPIPPPAFPPPKEGAATPIRRRPPPPATPPATPADERFVAAATFDGAREGMVFKMGERGLGYYTDRRIEPVGGGGVGRGGGGDVAKETIDHARTVVRRSARWAAVGDAMAAVLPPREGSARVGMAPVGEPCARRAGTSWRWSEPRRGVAN